VTIIATSRISARTVVAAAALALAVVSVPVAAAATLHTGAGHAKSASGQQLAGTWLTTITLTNPPPGVVPSFTALDTFLPSGELLVSSSQPMPASRSLAQGGWIRTGNRRFASSFTWFRFDATGAFIGMQRVRRTMTLAANLATFSATDVVEALSPTGAVVATVQGAETGNRLPVSGA
jgi:hypothetical protein